MNPRKLFSIHFTLALTLLTSFLALHAEEPETPVLAAKTGPTSQLLFEARTAGYYTYRIPGLLVTKKGSVLASVEARKGKGGDWDPIDIVIRRSTDGGKTWSPPQCLVKQETYEKGPISNFVMISDASDGAVHAVFSNNYSRVFYLRSDDDGVTFSKPVEITEALTAIRKDYAWNVIATGPAHGTQLRTGRLVVPIWMADGKDTGKATRPHRPSAVSSIFSDDHGKTWQCGEIVCRREGEFVNPSETIMVELSDGRVLFNMRSESKPHKRVIASSPDGATKWSKPEFDPTLFDPVCMASLIRYDEKRILFANPDNGEQLDSPKVNARKRLTIKLSRDDAKTWPVARVLEEGVAGYSDLGVLPDGTILCVFEGGSVTNQYDNKGVTLLRFGIDWVESGK